MAMHSDHCKPCARSTSRYSVVPLPVQSRSTTASCLGERDLGRRSGHALSSFSTLIYVNRILVKNDISASVPAEGEPTLLRSDDRDNLRLGSGSRII
jgi:hypothetical protein